MSRLDVYPPTRAVLRSCVTAPCVQQEGVYGNRGSSGSAGRGGSGNRRSLKIVWRVRAAPVPPLNEGYGLMMVRRRLLRGAPLRGDGHGRKAARTPRETLAFVWTCLVLVILSGCAHAAPPSAPPPADRRAAVRAIVLCTSTEAELRAALGEPTRDGLLRRERILSWIIDEGAVVSYLAVLLDARGVVVDRAWDLPTEIPWTPADQCSAGGTAR